MTELSRLRGLGRPEVVALVRALIIEQGYRVIEQQLRGRFAEFSVVLPSLFDASSAGLVRLYFEPIDLDDVEQLRQLAADDGLAQVICFDLNDGETDAPTPITIMRVPELLRRLKESAFVSWQEDVPRLSEPDIIVASGWNLVADALVHPALRWLPTLARNRLPPPLRGTSVPAHRIFERAAFKVLTEFFGMGGESWGETALFQTKPDGWIGWSTGAAIYDCKASARGYRMTAQDWRAFVDYVKTEVPKLRRRGIKVTHVVVLSSGFPGPSGRRHPVRARGLTLRSRTGLNLSYLSARELVAFGRRLERIGASPAEKRGIDWESLLLAIPAAASFDREIDRIQGARS